MNAMTTSSDAITIHTIGCSKKSAAAFFDKLKEAGIQRVIDVRLRNTSHLVGFAKRDDLEFFLRRIADIDYIHTPELAPTETLLDDYLKRRIDWPTYEHRFNKIMRERRIENTVAPDELEDACLLCSEPMPDKCHRRLVAGYLRQAWGNVRIKHIL